MNLTELKDLICKNCNFKQNISDTEETGKALCTFSNNYFPVDVEDRCHYIPELGKLKCGDCARYGEDFACLNRQTDDSAIQDDSRLCSGFEDKKEEEFMQILMLWKIRGLYDRDKVNRLMNEFEQEYERLLNQK